MSLTGADKAVFTNIETFLRHHKANPVDTVVNTIFPAGMYNRYGRSGVFQHYRDIAPKVKQHSDVHWGTYAMRMNNRQGRDGECIHPLEDCHRALQNQPEVGTSKPATLRRLFHISLAVLFKEI
jgi:hypothetical protein